MCQTAHFYFQSMYLFPYSVHPYLAHEKVFFILFCVPAFWRFSAILSWVMAGHGNKPFELLVTHVERFHGLVKIFGQTDVATGRCCCYIKLIFLIADILYTCKIYKYLEQYKQNQFMEVLAERFVTRDSNSMMTKLDVESIAILIIPT